MTLPRAARPYLGVGSAHARLTMNRLEWWTDIFCAKKKRFLCLTRLKVMSRNCMSHSHASHTLHREGSGHAAIIELSPRQKLDVTNQIGHT